MDIYQGDRRDDWETPPDLFDKVWEKYKFTLDLAASESNRKIAAYFSEKDNSLSKNWSKHGGPHWMNPPFSQATEFFAKAAAEDNKMVAIYKAANLETVLWQDIILGNATWVCFIKKRVNYLDHEGNPSSNVSFGSALIGYRVDCRVEELGKVWKLK